MKCIIICIMYSIVWFAPLEEIYAQDADFKGSGYKSWVSKTNQKNKSRLFGGEVQNYNITGRDWATIENEWINDGGSLFVADKAIIKSKVRVNGESEAVVTLLNGKEYKVTQSLNRLVWFRKGDSSWFDIFTNPNFSNLSFDQNRVDFTNVFPAIDYSVIKNNGRLEHLISFKPPFLDSAIALYDQRSDTADIYLANVLEYTLSNNITDHDISLGNIKKGRKLSGLDRYAFKIESDQLFYPGWLDSPAIDVNQRWVFKNDRLFEVEFVKMSEIKRIHELFPDSTISHNDSFTFGDSLELLDGYVFRVADTGGFFRNTGSTNMTETDDERLNFFRINTLLDSIASGSEIDSSIWRLQLTGTGLDTCYITVWTHFWDTLANNSGATQSVGQHGPSYKNAKDSLTSAADIQWTDVDSVGQSDYDDNSGNYFDTLFSPASNSNMTCTSGVAATGNCSQVIKDWTDGTKTNYGVGFSTDEAGSLAYRPVFVGIPSFRPFVYIEWTEPVGGADPSTRRKKIIQRGEYQSEKIPIFTYVPNMRD